MHLGNENALWLLFLVPVVLVPVYLYCFWRKAKALRILASVEMLGKINTSVSLRKQILKAVLLTAAFVSVIVAMTEPKWNPKPQRIKRHGRDVAILLDVSRSMLAEDITPSRLRWSKLAIKDLLEVLGGDRIGIVTFAGNSTVQCPLTQDYAFVQMVLADIGTESVGRGGTNVGDAIRKATEELFDQQSRQYKDIILITDGEEHKGYESFPIQAAEKAAAEGIRIIAIGLGDDNEGSRIPITGGDGRRTFLKYQGEEVWSKLDSDTLRQVAASSNSGRYLGVRPGETLDLGQVYANLIESAEKRELESATMTTYDERFQVFVALAIALVVAEAFVSEGKKAS